MIVCIIENVQWRWALNDSTALGYDLDEADEVLKRRAFGHGGGGALGGRGVDLDHLGAGDGASVLEGDAAVCSYVLLGGRESVPAAEPHSKQTELRLEGGCAPE